MVTIFRESGLRFVIFIDDHAPPHVHIFGDGTAKIELGAQRRDVRIVDAEDMKTGVLRKAKRIVIERHEELLMKWREFHG